MLSPEGTYRSPCRSRKDTFLFLRNVLYFLSVSYFSLSVSLGKCSISFLNLHENILKGWRDLITATFLELLINTYPQKPKAASFHRDIFSNPNDKPVTELQCMCAGVCCLLFFLKLSNLQHPLFL